MANAKVGGLEAMSEKDVVCTFDDSTGAFRAWLSKNVMRPTELEVPLGTFVPWAFRFAVLEMHQEGLERVLERIREVPGVVDVELRCEPIDFV